MDEDTIKKKGAEPLHDILQQVANLFPVDGSALGTTPLQSKDREDLADTIVYLAKIRVPSLISCGAGADDKDPDVVVVQCAPPYSVGLPAKDYYSDEEVTKKYEAAVTQVIENLYPDNGNTALHVRWSDSGRHSTIAARINTKDFAHGVVELEKQLAAASPDAEDRDDVTVSLADPLHSYVLMGLRNITTRCL